MTPEIFESLGWVLTYLVIALVLFLLLRSALLWYLRLGEIADHLAAIRKALEHRPN